MVYNKRHLYLRNNNELVFRYKIGVDSAVIISVQPWMARSSASIYTAKYNLIFASHCTK